jgi:hypothetical protein
MNFYFHCFSVYCFRIPKEIFIIGCIPYFLLCSKPSNPLAPENAKVFLTLESSHNIASDTAITDSTEKTFRIGVSFFLSSAVDSMDLSVGDSITDFSTSLVNLRQNSDRDTMWYAIAIGREGCKTVKARAFCKKNIIVSDSAVVHLYHPNRKPHLNVSGNAMVIAEQPCSLIFSAQDSDANQIDSIAIIKAPMGAIVSNGLFLWTPQVADTGRDTVVTTAVDNGNPPLSDTIVIVITIVKPSPANPYGFMVLNRTPSAVYLKWDKDGLADTVMLYRNTAREGDGFVRIGRVIDTFYTDTGLIARADYYYFIVAKNSSGLSPSSDTVWSGPGVKRLWKHDFIHVDLTEGLPFSLYLPDSCINPNDTGLSFSLQNGNPVADSLKGKIYTFTPGYYDSGTYRIVLAVTDGIFPDTMVMEMHVTNKNRPPAFVSGMPPISGTLSSGSLLSIPFMAKDPDGDPVSYFVRTQSTLPRATQVQFGNNVLQWQSQLLDTGRFSIDIGATDGVDSTLTSIWITITMGNRPPKITLISPDDGSGAIPKNVRFTWSGTDEDHDSLTYSLFTGPDSFHLQPAITGADTTFDLQAAAGLSYYWKVSVTDGKAITESEIRHFSVNSPPVVTLRQPENAATGIYLPVLFAWNGSDPDVIDTGRLRYDFYCALQDSSLTRIVKDTAAKSCRMTTLAYNKTYRWKVVAKDGKDSAESLQFSFSTLIPSAQLASLQLTNNAVLVPNFQAATLRYGATVPYETDSIAIIPRSEDSLAQCTINGIVIKSGSSFAIINPPIGNDTIIITVTARDQSASNRYTIILTRAKPITFQRYMGINNTDAGQDVLMASDSGYFVTGNSNNSATTGYTRIAKLDRTGAQVWSQRFGNSSGYSQGVALTKASDGNCMALAFWTTSDSGQTPHAGLFEVDNSGTTQWGKIFRAPGYDQELPRAMIRTNDNGYLIAAKAESASLRRADIWLIKTTSTGALSWDTVFSGGGSYGDVASVTQTPDNGYAVCGYLRFSTGQDSVWVLKIDAAGKPQWSKTYPDLFNGSINGIGASSGGALLICGSNANNDGFIGKLSSTGQLTTLKNFVGNGNQNLSSIQPTKDGNFILSGWSTSVNGDLDGWLVKVTPEGETLWSRTIGTPLDDAFHGAKQTYDGGYIVTGSLFNSGMWVLKTDRDGQLW